MSLFKWVIVKILTFESRLILAKYKPFIVAVTGSVGKTTTKDAIFSVLADRGGYVRKSEKSMNSEIGLPLTVIGAPNAWHNPAGWLRNIFAGLGLILKRREYPDCLVLEVGADHPGDIRHAARLLKPDIAVITRVSKTPVHVEFFYSPEEVLMEKALLAAGVKNGGTLVVYGDDDNVQVFKDQLGGRNVSVITYGMAETAGLRGYVDSMTVADGTKVSIKVDNQVFTVSVKRALGLTYIYPILAAAAVGVARGMSGPIIVEHFAKYIPPKGRMNIIEGIKGSTIIDDTYNSSPDAVRSALETLRGLQCAGHRIAVLGDMMELGRYSSEEHRRIGLEAMEALYPGGTLITVGPRSKTTAAEAIKAGMIPGAVNMFDEAVDVPQFLVPQVAEGDIILVKGSQSMRMERVVKALMRDPSSAPEFLVRQEVEWLERK